MNALQKIRMGLLLAKIKLGGVYTRDWEKDPNPENWRTINGSHVHLVNGKIDGGAGGKFKGNNWTGQKAHGSNSFFPRFNYQQNLFGGQEVMPSKTMQKETNRQKRIARRAQRRNERNEANKAAGLARQAKIRAQRMNQSPWEMSKRDLKAEKKRLSETVNNEYWTFSQSPSSQRGYSAASSERLAQVRAALGEKVYPWQMTGEEAKKRRIPENKRQESIKKALEQGLPVPENVKAEYKPPEEQPQEKTYSAIESVAELRKRAKARKAEATTKAEKQKSTTPRKKGTMKSRLWDNAKEAGIDLDAFHVGGGKWDKRNTVHIDLEKMPKEQQAAFTQMAKEKGYTMSWNGGLGYVIKEPVASTKPRAYKPTEKTAAPEGYEEYLKRKNSGELNSYEEQQEARRERFEGRSAAATAESRQRSQAARNIMSMIPAGQPILVGHHSERRHRSDINKVDTNMRKSWEASQKADYYAQRAESVGTGGISSVDPDAVFKVYEKLHDLEVLQDKMKEANASGTKQYPSYALVNNSSEIRRLKKRLEDLSKAASTEGQSIESNTLYDLKQEEGRYQFKFDGKPSDEVRSILKHNGFKWSPSRGTWVRSAAGSGKYAMERVKKELEPHIVIPF